MIKTMLTSSPIRQLLGAAGGALVALALFTVYREARPMVRAYLVSDERIVATEVTKEVSMDAVVRLREAVAQARAARLLDPDPVPVVALVVSDAEAVQKPSVVVSTAPALPRSGIGIGMSMMIALGVSIVFRQRPLSHGRV